jgi:hypothetical protein
MWVRRPALYRHNYLKKIFASFFTLFGRSILLVLYIMLFWQVPDGAVSGGHAVCQPHPGHSLSQRKLCLILTAPSELEHGSE